MFSCFSLKTAIFVFLENYLCATMENNFRNTCRELLKPKIFLMVQLFNLRKKVVINIDRKLLQCNKLTQNIFSVYLEFLKIKENLHTLIKF